MSAGTGATKAPRSVREEAERLFVLLRRSLGFWKRALLAFVLTAAVAVPWAMTRPRTYRSETVILYQETIRSADVVGGGGDGADNNARRVGARLREVLLSRASLEPIVSDMHLFVKPSEANDKKALVDAVDDMRKQIAFRSREGDTFEIAYDGKTPEEAQEVTRRLAECIIQEASTRRAERAKTLKAFLDAESDRNEVALRLKESSLATFLAAHPEFATPLPGDPTNSLRQGGRPGAGGVGAPSGGGAAEDPALASLERKAARLERQIKAAKSGAGATPTPTPAPKPTVLPDSPELVAARKDLDEKLSRYTDKHPDVIAAKARLRAAQAAQATAQAAADAKAAAAAKAAAEEAAAQPASGADVASLERDLADARAQIAARRAALAKSGGAGAAATAPRAGSSGGAHPAPSTAAPSPAAAAAAAAAAGQERGSVALEVEFRRLQREVNEARDRQRELDDRRFKASITASSVMDDRNIQVSVLDPAYLPTHPISRPRRYLFAGALLACLLMALLTALVSARLDDRIHDRVDLELIDGLPLLGVIPAPKALPRKTG
jgi:uncharacterized protein involved in exopolysaccharide biosynthesis